jgi:type IV pilus assembly protein PilM
MRWSFPLIRRGTPPIHVGVDIGQSGVRLVALEPGPTPRIVGWSSQPGPEGRDDGAARPDREWLVAALGNAAAEIGIHEPTAAVAIPIEGIATRCIPLPPGLSHRAVHARINLAMAEQLPEAVSDFCVDYRPDDGAVDDHERQTWRVVAARRSHVAWRVAAIKALGWRCPLVDVESHAIARALRLSSPAERDFITGVVDAGYRLRFSVCDGDSLIHDQDHGPPQPDTPEAVAQRIGLALSVYQGLDYARAVDQILLVGGRACSRLADSLAEQTQLPTRIADPFTALSARDSDNPRIAQAHRYPVALGLARHLGSRHAHWR